MRLKDYIALRIKSDRGDGGVSISQILWMVFAVVLVMGLGKLTYDAIMGKGNQMADCIKNSNLMFTGSSTNTNCN